MPGGTAFYFSKALGTLGVSIGLLTKLARTDRGLLSDLETLPVNIQICDSKFTTTFENIYASDLNVREQKIKEIATSFFWEELKTAQADYIHLGPLTPNEISSNTLSLISTLGKLSLDVQGFLRDVSGNRVTYKDWEEKAGSLKYISILKANQKEAEIMTGNENTREAAREIASYGVREVVITLSEKGSIILFDGHFYSIPAFRPDKLVDTTGCGDTYMAGYLWKRSLGKDIAHAGKFGSAMASLKIEKFGGFDGKMDQILERMLKA